MAEEGFLLFGIRNDPKIERLSVTLWDNRVFEITDFYQNLFVISLPHIDRLPSSSITDISCFDADGEMVASYPKWKINKWYSQLNDDKNGRP